jgi:hypothetical protein
LTFAEAKAHQERLIADARFNPEFDQLIDLRAVTLLDLSPEEVRTIARRNPFSRRTRRALLASSPHIFEMLRMAMAHHEMIPDASEVAAFLSVARPVCKARPSHWCRDEQRKCIAPHRERSKRGFATFMLCSAEL